MPRKVRIDAPGVLHHIIVCIIERRRGFSDDHDRLLCYRAVRKFCLAATELASRLAVLNHR
jgi:hypothetical protein